ncbi:hypothetical protein [Ktedonospora formicarum]|uniref:Uncharacterized protein n=1 Tax=Ktedonospora formicarum TaxID=2778364 RepID=A0A8J3MTA8_9CHLR|nr:hypothetical protein [Ktedonospora formicarum]GHO44165.1 hypothetical protein KSX_23280 [Ktedonospora formicarum]
MSTYQNPNPQQTPIVAGVFQNENQAKVAVDELRKQNFAHDQIGVAIPQKSQVDSLSQDFMKLGVPQEKATYYEDEFKSGHIVVSVRPDGRDEEAQSILFGSGGYNESEKGKSESQSSTQNGNDR